MPDRFRTPSHTPHRAAALRFAGRLAVLALAPAMLAGCTMTLPVHGSIASRPPTAFSGSATGHMDGAGELDVTLADGVKCEGHFVYVNGRQGSGTFECGDGRTGPFDFVSTGSRGTGSGTLGGVPFTFTFG